MFIFTFPAVYTMDTFGRRNLLLLTFPNMAWCLLADGCCFLSSSVSARVPLITFFIYYFTALYGPGKQIFLQIFPTQELISTGIGPMPSVYFSEAFPLSHREIGAAFTICIDKLVGSALSLTFPLLLVRFGPTGGELHSLSCPRIV